MHYKPSLALYLIYNANNGRTYYASNALAAQVVSVIFGVRASLVSGFSVFTFAALRLAHATMHFAWGLPLILIACHSQSSGCIAKTPSSGLMR